MDYNLLTDDDIVRDLANRFEKLRVNKHLKEMDLEELAGISRKTLYNFRHGAASINLKSFIRLLRAVDVVDRLQLIFPEQESYSPKENTIKVLPKRVRDKRNLKGEFKWGDEN